MRRKTAPARDPQRAGSVGSVASSQASTGKSFSDDEYRALVARGFRAQKPLALCFPSAPPLDLCHGSLGSGDDDVNYMSSAAVNHALVTVTADQVLLQDGKAPCWVTPRPDGYLINDGDIIVIGDDTRIRVRPLIAMTNPHYRAGGFCLQEEDSDDEDRLESPLPTASTPSASEPPSQHQPTQNQHQQQHPPDDHKLFHAPAKPRRHVRFGLQHMLESDQRPSFSTARCRTPPSVRDAAAAEAEAEAEAMDGDDSGVELRAAEQLLATDETLLSAERGHPGTGSGSGSGGRVTPPPLRAQSRGVVLLLQLLQGSNVVREDVWTPGETHDVLVIGTAPEAGFRVDAASCPGVAACHATVEHRRKLFVLVDESGEPPERMTRVSCHQPVRLHDWMSVRVGDVVAPVVETNVVMPHRAMWRSMSLRVTQLRRSQRQRISYSRFPSTFVHVQRGQHALGRSPMCDIVVRDFALKPMHVQFFSTGGIYFVETLVPNARSLGVYVLLGREPKPQRSWETHGRGPQTVSRGLVLRVGKSEFLCTLMRTETPQAIDARLARIAPQLRFLQSLSWLSAVPTWALQGLASCLQPFSLLCGDLVCRDHPERLYFVRRGRVTAFMLASQGPDAPPLVLAQELPAGSTFSCLAPEPDAASSSPATAAAAAAAMTAAAAAASSSATATTPAGAPAAGEKDNNNNNNNNNRPPTGDKIEPTTAAVTSGGRVIQWVASSDCEILSMSARTAHDLWSVAGARAPPLPPFSRQCFAAKALSALRSIKLLSELTLGEVARVAVRFQPVRPRHGDVIIRRGAQAGDESHFFLIVAGEVEVETPSGERVVRSRGYHVGEMALLLGGARNATVRALGDDTLLGSLDRRAFDQLLRPLFGYVSGAATPPTAPATPGSAHSADDEQQTVQLGSSRMDPRVLRDAALHFAQATRSDALRQRRSVAVPTLPEHSHVDSSALWQSEQELLSRTWEAMGVAGALEYGLVLTAISGPDRGKDYVVRDRAIIGSDPNCSITIGDRLLSSRNTVIEYRGGKYWVRDLDSRHGTFVKLRPGDELTLMTGETFVCGNTEFQVLSRHRSDVHVMPTVGGCCSVS